MRINIMNKNEMNNLEQITKIANEAFSKTDYKITIVPYDFEKSREAHREYYKKNKERLQAKNKELKNVPRENKQDESTNKDSKLETKAVEVKDPKQETKPIEKKDTKTDSKVVAAKDTKTKKEAVKDKKA